MADNMTFTVRWYAQVVCAMPDCDFETVIVPEFQLTSMMQNPVELHLRDEHGLVPVDLGSTDHTSHTPKSPQSPVGVIVERRP